MACYKKGSAPDASTATLVGSCTVPYPVADRPDLFSCHDYGYAGPYPTDSSTVDSLESLCGKFKDSTWSTDSCDRENANFGCQTVTSVGPACASVITTWYFGNGKGAATACPDGTDTVDP